MAHLPTVGSCSRRHFLSGCAACAGCVAGGGLLASRAVAADGPAGKRPKIRLVFCETANNKPIWPNIGYDFDARRNRLLAVLTEGCPDLQLLPAKLMDHPADTDEVLKGDAEVDGYLVCLQGLGWQNNIGKLCTTGKPTLLVDNLFGGSGLFLSKLHAILGAGKPVDWVSSASDRDIVASARNFGLLGQGKPAAEVAAAFRATRQKNTPAVADWSCKSDPVAAPDFDAALAQLRKTKLLVVGGGWGGDAFRKASQEVIGVQFIPISFEQLAAAYAEADQAAGKAFAERWITSAEKVVDTARADIEKAGQMYVAMKRLMDQHGARGISINCLGGFYGGHMQAYPCLGFSQFNNDGLVGGCEADQMSALTMATLGALFQRPGYISDPVIDTSHAQIIYAHCVATTRPFGPAGAANPYRLLTHSEDRKGASVQSLLPAGYMTTTLEINPTSREVLLHQAKTTGNNPSDMACRTKLEAVVKGDLEKLTENWRMGWHRVTCYGDVKAPIAEFCQRLKLKLIEEA